MAEHVEHVKNFRRSGDTVHTSEVIDERDPSYDQSYRQNVAARVVWYIAGVLLTLLALRFVFALLGANSTNAFANFVYSVTYPFVAPFFGLFNYNYRYGVSQFESYTLVAMVVYALIAYGISRLITINASHRE